MHISQATTPLRFIFWGGLLCVLDFSFSSSTTVNGVVGSGFRFDILNDLVGMILVTIGVVKLGKFEIDLTYRRQMLFVYFCCIIGCIKAFLGHFIFTPSAIVSLIGSATSILSLVGTILFTNAMVQLASSYQLHRSAASWRLTRILMVLFWCVPMGISNLMALTGGFVNLGLIVIPLLLAMIVPLIHLFISTSRMREEAGQSVGLVKVAQKAAQKNSGAIN